MKIKRLIIVNSIRSSWSNLKNNYWRNRFLPFFFFFLFCFSSFSSFSTFSFAQHCEKLELSKNLNEIFERSNFVERRFERNILSEKLWLKSLVHVLAVGAGSLQAWILFLLVRSFLLGKYFCCGLITVKLSVANRS